MVLGFVCALTLSISVHHELIELLLRSADLLE